MDRTANNDLSFAANLRIQNTGYVRRQRRVRIAIREKLGLSKPRNSGFDRDGSNLRSVSLRRRDCGLETRDLSEHQKLAVDGDVENRVGYSGSNSLLLGVRRGGSAWMRGAAGFSVAWGLESSSLMRLRSMLRVCGGEGVDGLPCTDSTNNK